MLEPSAAEASRSQPERRFLTIVFVDLIGYSTLSERLDPEDLGKLQQTYQRVTLETMERYGGFVARFVGDGALVYFGYPRAHERDAERAVRAALDLLERLRRLNPQDSGTEANFFQARIGIHSGLVVVAQELMSAGASAPGIVGDAANLAARLQADAPPGGILVSGDTFELVEGLLDHEALGGRLFKGLSRETSVYLVRGMRPAPRRMPMSFARGATRMVGRQEPLDAILARWRLATSGKGCQTVAVVADAGGGKTRLAMELCNHPEMADALVLKAHCHELFARTPLHPVSQFLWTRAGLTVEDSASESEMKLASLLEAVKLHDPDNLQVALSLLDLRSAPVDQAVAPTPQILRRKQYEFIVAVFRHLAQQHKTVLLVEDTHWLDPSSAELLTEVVTALKDAPALVLLTMRSFPAGPTLPKADDLLRLARLSDAECSEIARSVPGAELLSPETIAQAVRSADGVPLFVEHLVMSLLDERGQASSAHNRRLGGVPLLLAEMMSERLDRLAGGRRIVQAAACIGRSFAPELLLAVLQENATTVARPLEDLVAAELLQPRRYGAEIRYEFCHALLQRMAYESMVQNERRAMHSWLVDVLRQNQSAWPTQPEVMAHHLTEAGRTTEAIEAWLQAGTAAAAQSANVEAVDHLRRGLALLDKVEDAAQRRQFELKLQVTLMGSILATQSATSPELHACCERGLQLCQEGPPTPLVFPFAFGKFTYVNCRGNVVEAEQLARLFLSLSEKNGFDSGRVIGHRMLGMALLGQGRGAQAREQIEASLAAYVPERDDATTRMFGQNTEVHSKSLLSLTLFSLGDTERALQVGVDALQTADALRHPHSTAIPLVYVGGWVFGLCDATEAMRQQSRRLLQLAEQHRLAGFRAHGLGFFGWSLCQQGQLAQGIAAIEQAVAAFDAVSFRLGEAGHLANLAQALRQQGRLADARARAQRAVELIPEGGQWLEPEVLRVAGVVEADVEPSGEQAEQLLRRALAAAQQLAFPILERRCLLSLLGELARRQRPAEPDLASRLAELTQYEHLERQVNRALEVSELAATAAIADGHAASSA